MGALKDKKFFLSISIFILCIVVVCLSGCVQVSQSYIPSRALPPGWYQNLSLRNTGTTFLGLEQWIGVTYEISGDYPASITITTVKTIILADEQNLLLKTREVIESTFLDTILFNSSFEGERMNSMNHQTRFVIYNGYDMVKHQDVRVIGEVWNCDDTGSSVICIGVAYVSSPVSSLISYKQHWYDMVMDPVQSIEHYGSEPGIIYSVRCH